MLDFVLILGPYLWLIVIINSPKPLWDIIESLDRPWRFLLTNIQFSDFAPVVMYALLILVPIHSLKIIHKKSLIRIAGLDVKWTYIVSNLAILIFLYCLSASARFFSEAIAPAIAEEVFFRLYLLGPYLKEDPPKNKGRFAVWLAFFASNITWIGLHFVDGFRYSNILERFLSSPSLGTLWNLCLTAFLLFIGGTLFSKAYEMTGTILSSIVTHTAWNIVAGNAERGGIVLLVGIALFALWTIIRARSKSTDEEKNSSSGNSEHVKV